jgi:hypothetical protein
LVKPLVRGGTALAAIAQGEERKWGNLYKIMNVLKRKGGYYSIEYYEHHPHRLSRMS